MEKLEEQAMPVGVTLHNGASSKDNDFISGIRLSDKFAKISKLIIRDLNNYTNKPTFSKYKKDDIAKYLENPYQYEKELRRAIVYIYGASPHFRRLIQYFTSLSDFAYVVSPYKIDPNKANMTTMNRNYRKVLSILSSMSIKTQFPKILKVCLREDVFYGTMWVGADSVIIQQLPSDYCKISTIENNVPNVTFDFTYFDSRPGLLDYYPQEFKLKYESIYKKNVVNHWIELDAPTSFAIKSSSDLLDYALPPFAGILREIYDLEDYKGLKMSKETIENYALLSMKLPMDDEGNWLMDEHKAEDFWSNLDSVLPEEVGSVLTPMDIDKISFERTHTGDTDTIAEAEENLFTAAGVSSQLFNNAKASANALLLSIKADQALTFGIVKNIQDMLNRFIQYQNYGRNWKVTFLDCSVFNRDELGSMYLKGCQYGLPLISMYAATQGLDQAELDSMNYLEDTMLGLVDKFKPLRSSATLSAEETNAATDEGGAPKKDIGELTDSGEQSREDGDDW